MTQPARPKHGGRQKGTPNKAARKRISVADKLEERGVDLIAEVLKTLEGDYKITVLGGVDGKEKMAVPAMPLVGKERADILLKLLEYCAPKMKSVEIKAEDPDGTADEDLDRIPRAKLIELMKGA